MVTYIHIYIHTHTYFEYDVPSSTEQLQVHGAAAYPPRTLGRRFAHTTTTTTTTNDNDNDNDQT